MDQCAEELPMEVNLALRTLPPEAKYKPSQPHLCNTPMTISGFFPGQMTGAWEEVPALVLPALKMDQTTTVAQSLTSYMALGKFLSVSVPQCS